MEFNHIPVLLEESIEMLNLSDASIVLDATFGHGGHTEKILESIGPKGHVNANDRDMSTKMHYERLLKKYNNLSMTNFSFSNLEDISTSSGIKAFDAILIDIGVSSEQFDNANRGFSFQNDGPLDMRMDNRQELDAGVVVNTFSQAELEKIFIEYGEEWRGKKISEYIVKERENNIIKTTGQLSQLVEKIIKRTGKRHPATKVFQALRIYVNNELGELEMFLNKILDYLNPSGRLGVISFHSLEDRIVKNKFRELSGKCMCRRPLMDCICKLEKKVKLINKKPIIPQRDEIKKNRRSRSAKLRVIEKI